MIKIKNNILIYFIFYINNISFLRNEENEQIHNQVIKSDNNEEINSEQTNKNITSENKIKKYKLIFNNIFNKINKKNIWRKIIIGFFGFGLLLIFFFNYEKIFKIYFKYFNFYKKRKKINLIKDFFRNKVDEFNIFICISIETDDFKRFNRYTYIKSNQIFLEYFNELINYLSFIEINSKNFQIDMISFKDITNELKNIENIMNNLKNQNQKTYCVINTNIFFEKNNEFFNKINEKFLLLENYFPNQDILNILLSFFNSEELKKKNNLNLILKKILNNDNCC